MQSHRLYYSNFCFFCHKVLSVLHGKNHNIDLASTSDHDNYQALVSGGGKGQVPCLRIEAEDGRVTWLYESDDILQYIKHHELIVA